VCPDFSAVSDQNPGGGLASLVGLLGWMSAMHADTGGNQVSLKEVAYPAPQSFVFRRECTRRSMGVFA
jgi:hypothetical protein